MPPLMNPSPSDLERIRELIRAARRILMVCHVAPDGDAIGSTLGLAWLLWAQDKELTLACEDPVPEAHLVLPGSEHFVRQGLGSYDLVISLDCSDRRRMGRVYDESVAGLPLINVDHHITNTFFGTVDWVAPSRVATAQIILDWVDAFGWELTSPVATCLLTGLLTDTRSFRTSNVDGDTLRAALRLVEAGASLSDIAQRALDQRSLASVVLWGQAFAGLQLQDDILVAEVTRAMRREADVSEEAVTGLVNFLSGVREARIVAVFTERDDGTVDVSMRSAPGIDVAQVALRLGGGGHPLAAGCTLEEPLPRARERVLAELNAALAAQPTQT